ncbi:MAG: redoxin domain-containing protein, partial [Halobacteria archaeon]|nr:redoxin domain-containing protein [Halobacteria archaeon]
RSQTQEVAEKYGGFEDRNAEVVVVLPNSVEKAEKWHEKYDLPFPLLADSSKDVVDEYDQPVRFGALGSLHDMIGRMPQVVVFDTRDGELETEYVHKGSSYGDRPSTDELIEIVDSITRQ